MDLNEACSAREFPLIAAAQEASLLLACSHPAAWAYLVDQEPSLPLACSHPAAWAHLVEWWAPTRGLPLYGSFRAVVTALAQVG